MLYSDAKEIWGDPTKLSPEERIVYNEWLEAYDLDDKAYQAHYRQWLEKEIGLSSEYVRALAYGADCTAAHENATQSACINESLIGLYEFDDTNDQWKSSVFYDGTAYALDGTASLGDPKLGVKSAQFQSFMEGNTLYNANFPIDANEDFTIAFWLKHSDTASDQIILDSDKINLQYNYATGDFTFTVNTTSVTSVSHNHQFNTWTLLVLRKDSEYISIYGSYDGTTSLDCTSFDGTFSDAGGLTLGDTSHYIIGYIDELAVWQRCLSDEEVSWLDNTGDGRLISNFLCEGGVVAGGAATSGKWWSPPDIDGGVVAGGAATLPYYETGEGGAVAGGAAVWLLNFVPSVAGGIVAGGSVADSCVYSPAATGGAQLSGAATWYGSQSVAATGGALAGGRALYPFSVNVGGGALASGNAIQLRSLTEEGQGGAEAGGNAAVFVFIDTSGGALASGTASDGFVYTLDTSGGARLNGTRLHPYTEETGGGAEAGGEALITRTLPAVDIDGGVVVDGTASEYWTLTMFGGARTGGEAKETASWWNVGAGGVVCGMDPTFPNGYTYRMKFIMPAGSVAEDIDKFNLILTGAPDSTNCDGSSFLVTNVNDTTLSSAKFSYNSSTGRFHVLAVTHLEANAENVWYVYYKP